METNYCPLFTVVTRNHNRYNLTKTFIEEIENIDYPNKNILIIDDGSTDGSGERIQKEFKDRVRVIFSKKYVEYCKGLNIGIRYALENFSTDYFFIINNDTRNFSKNYFYKSLEYFNKYDNIGKFGSLVFDYDKKPRGGGALMHKLGVDLVTPTEGYIIPTKVFQKIGLFDESLVRYFEDLDLIIRMNRNNLITIADKTISFEHLGGGTTKHMPFVRNFYRVRNLIWFIKRHLKDEPFLKKLRYFKGYMRNHYLNLLDPLKKLHFFHAFKVLVSIILGVIMGIVKSWNPKIKI